MASPVRSIGTITSVTSWSSTSYGKRPVKLSLSNSISPRYAGAPGLKPGGKLSSFSKMVAVTLTVRSWLKLVKIWVRIAPGVPSARVSKMSAPA